MAPETFAAPRTLEGCLYEPRWELTEQPAPHLAMASRSPFPTNSQGSWLIFTERSGVGMALEALLTERGETSVLAFPAERYERVEPNRYLVDPSCPADFDRLMADAFPADAGACRGVVHMWSMANIGSEGMNSGADGTASSQPSLSIRLDELSRGSLASSSSGAASQRPLGGVATQPGGECGPEPALQDGTKSPSEDLSRSFCVGLGPGSRIGSKWISIDAALDLGCISVLHLVQAMARARWREAPRLWLITRGAQCVTAETEIVVTQSPVWGLGRVVCQEHPEFRCKRLDLAPRGTPQEGRDVLHELLLPDEEDEIAFRYAGRYVHRLVQYGSRSGRSEKLAGVSKKLKT